MNRIRCFALAAGLCLSLLQTQAQDLQDILGQATDVTRKAEYDEEYVFDIYLQVETSGEDGKSMVFDGYLSRDGSHTAVLFSGMGEKTMVVIDTKHQTVLILSNAEGDKTGFALAINQEAIETLSSSLKNEFDGKSFNELKTGRTKEILGYTCEEYLFRDESGESRIWASEKLGQELKQVLEANKAVFGDAMLEAEGLQGMVMEYKYANDSGGVLRSMKVRNLDLHASLVIRTGDYKIMSMVQ